MTKFLAFWSVCFRLLNSKDDFYRLAPQQGISQVESFLNSPDIYRKSNVYAPIQLRR